MSFDLQEHKIHNNAWLGTFIEYALSDSKARTPTAPTKLLGWISLLEGNGFVFENFEQWNASWLRQSLRAQRQMYRLIISALTLHIIDYEMVECIEVHLSRVWSWPQSERGALAKGSLAKNESYISHWDPSRSLCHSKHLSSRFQTDPQSGRAPLALQPHIPPSIGTPWSGWSLGSMIVLFIMIQN